LDSEVNLVTKETKEDEIPEMEFNVQELTARGETQLGDLTDIIVSSPRDMDIRPEDINNHLF